MKLASKGLLLLVWLGTMSAQAQFPDPNPIKHVVVIVQENRTPDNLFQGLLTWPGLHHENYNIAREGVDSKGLPVALEPAPLDTPYDLSHAHAAFVQMYDGGRMDGADLIACTGICPPKPNFKYVDNSKHLVDPYLELAARYGWANLMFQSNQGPSYPAHQFLFGGTSAPSAKDDAKGRFIAENPTQPGGAKYNAFYDAGCLAPLGEWSWLIAPGGAETVLKNNPLGTFCFSRPTMASLLDAAGLTWKYYAPAASNPLGSNPGGSVWTAPASIRQICAPDWNYTQCTGPEWAANVDLTPAHVLTDIRACRLASVSWVIPVGQNSDHSGVAYGTGGPSWVAVIVDAIGADTACEDGAGYWSDTAIVITWDDWGGWYDHVRPTIMSGPPGSYQGGFRVPLLVVSAYTPEAYVDNVPRDFGSILKFIQGVFHIKEGSLGFADQRANDDLRSFFDFGLATRAFQVIQAPLDADFFINDTRPPEPPDTD